MPRNNNADPNWNCLEVYQLYSYEGELPENVDAVYVKRTGTTKSGYPAYSVKVYYVDGHDEILKMTFRNSAWPRTRWTLSEAKKNVQRWLAGKVHKVEVY